MLLRTVLFGALFAAACAEVPPARSRLHPLVRQMSDSDERSIESVARYVVAHERDPFERIKALHDWVVDHVRYDVAALAKPTIPFEDGDARWVFEHRLGVCAGYASLLAALGRAAGLPIFAVDGVVHTNDASYLYERSAHAWNLAEVAGRWYAIDATWDAGTVDDGKFHKRYSTKYLFASPWELNELSSHWKVELSLAELESHLDRVWREPVPRAERLAIIESIRAEAAPADDPDLGWAGDRARQIVDGWLRARK